MKGFLSNYFSQIRKKEVENFFPGYFSLIMATGIVSIASHALGMPVLGKVLFYFNMVFYAVLWFFFLQHIFRFPSNFFANLSAHAKSPGYLTVVAGTNVLGSQFVLIGNNLYIASALCLLGFVLWIVLLYSVICMLTVKSKKPSLEKGINGIWLLLVVSTQSIAVLGMQVAQVFPGITDLMIFNSVGFYLMGCMLYIILITLIFYRLTFFELNAEEFAPPYWINMGAVSITTLAGSTILLSPIGFPEYLNQIAPFLKGSILLFWSVGTWWIPIIVVLGIWRHIYKKIPLFYHHQYWGMVFPLGMYTVCTLRLAEVLKIDFMQYISDAFIYIAIITWTLAFIGLMNNVFKNVKTARRIRNGNP